MAPTCKTVEGARGLPYQTSPVSVQFFEVVLRGEINRGPKLRRAYRDFVFLRRTLNYLCRLKALQRA